jgi:energy-coupling factor transporter ATP-binding protein EcfA2
MTRLLQIEKARFSYPQDGHGLQPFSLSLDKGQGVAITGPSGCGKSTLARCVCGLIPHLYHGQFEGMVLLDGLPMTDLPLWQIVERVGIVFQNPATQMLAPSVSEEIIFGLENLGLERSEIALRLEAVLDQFGLQAMRDRSPLTLSGGEQQKLALAAILARQPELVVLDEPLSMLDTSAAVSLLEALGRLMESGKALMICEHRHDYLQQIHGLDYRTMAGCPQPTQSETSLELGAQFQGGSFRLIVDGLAVQIAGRKILNGLDFDAQGGQILAVVGPNGAGKTTLLRALAGFQSFDGEVMIEVGGMRERPSFGMVFQNPDLQLFNASVKEEILYRVRQPDMDLYQSLITALGLSNYEQTPPLLLSEGEKRRLALATVLMRQPVHGLLLDEPSLGQDSQHKAFLLGILRALKEIGMLVLLATHDLELAGRADRLLLMEPGGLVSDGEPKMVFKDQAAWKRAGLILPDWMKI